MLLLPQVRATQQRAKQTCSRSISLICTSQTHFHWKAAQWLSCICQKSQKQKKHEARPHTHTRALRHIKAQMHTQHRPAKCTTTEAQVQSVVFCTAHCPTVVKHMGIDNSCTVKLWFAVIWQRPLQDRRNIRLHRP